MKTLLPLLLGVLGLSAGLGGGYALRPGPASEATIAEGPDAVDPAHATGPDAGHDAEPAPPGTDVAGTGGADHADAGAADEAGAAHGGADEGRPEYVKLSNQFIIPVVEQGRVASMVILSLTLEVTPGSTEAIFAIEPRLRDGFLQTLFDHANAGGFKGSFTDGANLIVLRRALLEVARKAAGERVTEVLIADIARQDN